MKTIWSISTRNPDTQPHVSLNRPGKTLRRKPRLWPVVLPMMMAAFVALHGAARAQVIKEPGDSLDALAFSSERLAAPPVVEPLDDVEVLLDSEVRNNWENFRAVAHGQWKASVDKRHGRIDFAEGSGVPWVPGRGNKVAYGADKKLDLAELESIARRFLPQVARSLGVSPSALVLNRGRSGHPADYLWFIDFDVYRGNIPIDGARVVFRINNGNLVQFGSENLPTEHARTPSAKLQREEALAAVAEYIGGFHSIDSFVDAGSLHLLTTSEADSRFDDGFEFGKGRGLAAAWQFTFRRDGSQGTWRARVDAETGEMLDFYDINDYAQATGGVQILGTSTDRPMPFTDLSSGGYTNSAGVYAYGSPVTSSLSGQYVRIVDACGAISVPSDASGNLVFGTSPGTDCTTPGFGGAGNTNSARTQFYHVNRAKEMARGWLPGNSWLAGQLTANVNINDTCNAFWDGSTINFYRSGGNCGNTGENEGVSLHEYGHGLDSNDGNGSSPEKGTGETYGDFSAALTTHTSCIGAGFSGSNCGGYGDACTSCTGVRDIDWAQHASNTPHTVANFTQVRCPTNAGYVGPCNREGHCESYISS
ncbi:MAG TPA: hypothetical protein VJ885_05515, partial [Thermoanaerobaculia bacterium]|nr:hypothetical protein [Thermoanaerobaculia bacterium]